MTEMLHWSGSPYEIGLKHGKEQRDGLRKVYESLCGGRAKAVGASEFEQMANEALPRYERFFQNDGPEILEEIRGIAEGSGMSYTNILLLNVLEGIEVFAPSGCTQVAVTGEITVSGELLIGKNEDGGARWHGHYAHVTIEPKKGRRFITYAQPGMVGAFIGLSETGLSYSQSSAGVAGDLGMGWPRLLLLRLMMER